MFYFSVKGEFNLKGTRLVDPSSFELLVLGFQTNDMMRVRGK